MPDIVLSSSQETALAQLREHLSVDDSQDRRIILVESLSGVGKSTVIERIKPEFGRHRLLPTEYLWYEDNLLRILKDAGGHIVTSTNPFYSPKIRASVARIKDPQKYDIFEYDWDPNMNLGLHSVDVQGMDEEEMRMYIESKGPHPMSVDDLVEFSLGVPGLANSLMTIPHITPEIAARQAAVYLFGQFEHRWEAEERAARFLKIQPSKRVKKAMTRVQDVHGPGKKSIYDRLPGLRAHYGIDDDVDVAFLAPESIGIYDESIGKHGIGISIYFPKLTEEHFYTVMEMLGFRREQKDFGEKHGRPKRWFAFDVDHKELKLYGRHANGEEYGRLEWEKPEAYVMKWLREDSDAVRQLIADRSIPFPQEDGDFCVRTYVNDHGAANYQPINFGWMVESFCQQTGIPYLAFNGMVGKTYVYDPRTQRLNVFDGAKAEQINSSLHELRMKRR